MQRLIFMLVVAASASLAAAQGVYKYTDSNGQTVYTDNPKAGNGTAQLIDTPPNAPPAPPKAATALSEADRKLLEDANRRSTQLDRATDDIVAASQGLREAEGRREQGIEPLEGERSGRRFRPEYWQRQQALEREVAAVRARLSEALERRNAQR